MLLAIINMLIIICCSYDFYSTFHVFDGAAYPYKLSRPLPLEPISHGNDGLFYYRTALSMEICDHLYGIFRLIKKLSDKQQGMLA